MHFVPGVSGIPPEPMRWIRELEILSNSGEICGAISPLIIIHFVKPNPYNAGDKTKTPSPLKFPLDKRPVWVYTYHNGICPCEIRRKRTVPPMGVVKAQRMESPGYRPCRIFTE